MFFLVLCVLLVGKEEVVSGLQPPIYSAVVKVFLPFGVLLLTTAGSLHESPIKLPENSHDIGRIHLHRRSLFYPATSRGREGM